MARKMVTGAENIGLALREAVRESRNPEEARSGIMKIMYDVRNLGFERLGIVAGPISSDGPMHTAMNLYMLKRVAQHYTLIGKCGENPFPVVSAGDMLSWDYAHRLAEGKRLEFGINDIENMQFLNSVVGSGYVTHLIMAPRWESSAEARAMVSIAKQKGLDMIDETHKVELQRILATSRRDLAH